MARVVNAIALGLVAVGASYALSGTQAEHWLVGRGAALIRAAADGSGRPRAPQEAAPQHPPSAESPHQALAVRSEPGSDAESILRLRFAGSRPELHLPLPAVAVPGEPTQQPPQLAPKIRLAEGGSTGRGSGGKAALKAVDGDPKQRLARSIQVELARVGCYSGTIDGDWNSDTRKAMKAFNDRVNATLPIAQPDYILLTLLQGHAARACGAICPPGQVEAENGSCLPRSVLAETRRQSAAPAGPAHPATGATALAVPSSSTLARPGEATFDRKVARPALESEAALLAQRKAAAEKAVAEAERARRETEALARRNVATAEADKARARAEEERRRQQAAESERQRIAAAEERKRRQTAEAEARAEAERLARLAEAEKARIHAEARRRAELAALAEREAHAARVVAGHSSTTAATQTLPAVPVDRPPAPSAPVATPIEPPAPVERAVAPKAIPKPPDARFVGRFLPPPTYRVGRLQPSRKPVARAYPAPRAPAARRSNVQSIFLDLVRSSP